MRPILATALLLLSALPASHAWAAPVTQFKCVYSALIQLNNGKTPMIYEIPLVGVTELLSETVEADLVVRQIGTGHLSHFLGKTVLHPTLGKLQKAIRNGKRIHLGDLTGSEFLDLLPVGEKHTFAITDEELILSPTSEEKVQDFLSKHYLISKRAKMLRFAGTLWKDENGVLHFNNDSGTYKADAKFLKAVARLLENNLKLPQVIGHAFGEH